MTKHIAVLKGGWSAEREVSLVSGAACAKALRELGYQVTEIDVQPDIAEVLARTRPDIVFNALHGRWGEDGCVQGLLELMKIPYTHSGVLASALAMDKPMAKKVFEAAGLRCPKGRTASKAEMLKSEPMKRPYVVKPTNEGSSVGVHLMQENTNFTFTAENWEYGEEVLVEEFIPGRELTVAVLNDQPLGVTEIRPKVGFYDYTNKYTEGCSEHLCPAPLPDDIFDSVMQMALAAHRALGCRGLSRSDFRYDDTNGKNGLYLLEVNTQPGMTPLSLSPEQAAHAGISFHTLVESLVENACCGSP
ncbi:MAG: D-alanine--D-alanine ligase [Pseudomonadota bacterium]|nr:D-alanine--D-alanine ligase [Pseudomonadota bacterium]